MLVDSAATDDGSIARETIYSLLSNHRRRFTIHIIKQSDDEIDVLELAEQITAWELDVSPEEVPPARRESVYISLTETHLPMLANYGLVTYDESANLVSSTPALAELSIYIENIQGTDIPWSLYYVGIASVSVLSLIAVGSGVPGISKIGPIGVSVLTIIMFTASSIVHYYDTKQSQLGNKDVPAKLRENN